MSRPASAFISSSTDARIFCSPLPPGRTRWAFCGRGEQEARRSHQRFAAGDPKGVLKKIPHSHERRASLTPLQTLRLANALNDNVGLLLSPQPWPEPLSSTSLAAERPTPRGGSMWQPPKHESPASRVPHPALFLSPSVEPTPPVIFQHTSPVPLPPPILLVQSCEGVSVVLRA